MVNNCKHDGCHCEVPPSRSDDHCSDYCKQHSTPISHTHKDCACGHPGCRVSARASVAGGKSL
jgi:hypothetical protein